MGKKPLLTAGRKSADARTWALEDHICRHCQGGRILRCVKGGGPTGGGNPIFKCADCGREAAASGPEALCWCGLTLRNQNGAGSYQCAPFCMIETYPAMRDAFAKCGCDPSRGEVGIAMFDDIRKATQA